MKTIGRDRIFIDYFQSACAAHRGLTNHFGVRVWEGRCSAIVKIADGQPFTYGREYLIPLDLEILPSHVRIIVDSHLLNYPGSDLEDVLTGRKPLQEALDSPAKAEVKRMAAGRG
jgi:hypothetical protein